MLCDVVLYFYLLQGAICFMYMCMFSLTQVWTDPEVFSDSYDGISWQPLHAIDGEDFRPPTYRVFDSNTMRVLLFSYDHDIVTKGITMYRYVFSNTNLKNVAGNP